VTENPILASVVTYEVTQIAVNFMTENYKGNEENSVL